MAYDVTKFLKLQNLKDLATRVNTDFATKAELGTAIAQTLKTGEVDGNTVKLYTTSDKSGTAAFTFDLPAEMFLDQAKTVFVNKFSWTEASYPGSTNPSLEGKPVMVLAVKGDTDVSYSFINMAALVDTYTAKATGKDASTTVTIAGYEVEVKVNISAEAGNALELKDDGLYVPSTDISGKADKVTSATAGNFAALDASGNLTDSGKKPTDYSKVEASSTDGSIKIDGVDVPVVSIATDSEVTEMLNEVFGSSGT